MLNKIGVRAHDYGKSTMEDLARRIRYDGYKTTQLALKKALINAQQLDEVLNRSYFENIDEVLKEKGLEVSVLGAYLNYAGNDIESRQKNISIMKRHIQLAKYIGARMVGTETGSMNDDYTAHTGNQSEEAYVRFRDFLKDVINEAEKEDTFFAIEAVSHHIIHTPQRLNRIVRDIDSDNLKVIFDISNLMTIDNWHDQEQIMSRSFELLGDKILVVHVKDFDFVNGNKVIVALGQGKLNLDYLIDLVKKSNEKIDLLGENIQEDKLLKTYEIIAEYFK